MKKKRNYRSYKAFLKKLRKQHGLTYKESRKVYTTMRKRFYRPLTAKDIDAHPRITNESVFEATGGKSEQYERETQLEEFIEALDNANIEGLFNKHYNTDGFEFTLDHEILKVSINTTKTRKHFSVRIA